MLVGPAHAVGVREVQMRFRPFPALRLSHRVCLSPELGGDQQIEQRHVFPTAAAILGEKIAQNIRVGAII